MANAYTKINSGQSNWTDPLNLMLAAYGKATDDTGWFDLPLINGFENRENLGITKIRKVGDLVELQLSVTNLTVNTDFLKLPVGFAPKSYIPTIVRGTWGNVFIIDVKNNGTVTFGGKTTGTFAADDYIGDDIVWFTN
ncbi:hypothetical protein ACFP1L_11885 [Lactiplantibacillus nangangensis]|uniref:Uncharacterized protein n=1 Tax=Lactiplantibacillus nangangensis TaxID=2559917 RepID=A0ABW1SMQ7_9LACO|nr:hypothetical protein [Lactiplantibacillus nangangensis]